MLWVKKYSDDDYGTQFMLGAWTLVTSEEHQTWYGVQRDINLGDLWTWNLWGPNGWLRSAGGGWGRAEEAMASVEHATGTRGVGEAAQRIEG